MFKNLKIALGIYIFVNASPLWAQSCKNLFSENKYQNLQSESEKLLNAVNVQVNKIDTAEKLAIALEQIGNISTINHDTVVELSKFFFINYQPSEIRKIVRDLLMSSKNKSLDSVRNLLRTYARRETDDLIKLLVATFPKPFSDAEYVKFILLGQQITNVLVKHPQLNQALLDYIQFQSNNYSNYSKQDVYEHFIDSMKKINNPLLLGQLVDRIIKSDRVTSMYILSLVIEADASSTKDTKLVIKGTNNHDENELQRAVNYILSMSSEILQEKAYFEFKSSGFRNSPQLAWDIDTVRVALRYLKRNNYELYKDNVEEVMAKLIQYPYENSEIDAALIKLLSTNSPDITNMNYEDQNTFIYAFAEIEIYKRYALGLTKNELVDFKYLKFMFSIKSEHNRLLLDKLLLDFDKKFKLEKFPKLKAIVDDFQKTK